LLNKVFISVTNICLCIGVSLLLIHYSPSLYAASYSEQKEDLEQLQKRIKNLQKQIRKDTRNRDESQSQLENSRPRKKSFQN